MLSDGSEKSWPPPEPVPPRSSHWAHLSDRLPHQFPHCGLFDAQDQPKPVLRRLKELRENHLR